MGQVETLWRSLPSLINIAGLMFLLFFVYAVLGMKLFGRVMFGENLTRHANFTNFWSRCENSLCENSWARLVYPASSDLPDSAMFRAGSPSWSGLYFCTQVGI